MALAAYAIAHAEVAHERVDDEVIVINLRTGAYFSLVGAAADAWDLLLAGAPADTVARSLAARYAVEEPVARVDLDPLVDSLVREDLLVAADRSAVAVTLDDGGVGGERTYRPPTLDKYDDMEELLLLDPIHEVDEAGWPVVAAEPADS